MDNMGGTPKLHGSGRGGKNPLEKKELDILDPEGKAESEGKKGIGDVIEGVKRAAENVKKVINIIKSLPPQVWLVIGIIILIIFIVGGFIGFFTLMPGLIIGNLKEIAKNAINVVQSWFTTEADAYIDEEDVVKLANYLEEMEYDLVGYGFIVPNSKFSNDNGYLTYSELMQEENGGYLYFDRRNSNDEEGAKYYSMSAEEDPEGTSIYDGYYYNSLGILIDNNTGLIVTTGDYVDEYGIERSTEEFNNSGAGVIVGFGNDWLSNVEDWTVDTKLLRSYLLSDYRIYAIRNNDDEGLLPNIYAAIRQTFGGYDAAWSKGLMKFYYATNGTADAEWSSSLGHWIIYGDDIKITRTSTGAKLSIKNGHFNNPTIFTIDGWADRYGMSLEFLLSLHLATMQPDLVYAMLQSFDTEVQVYLEDSGEAEVEAEYVDMMNESATINNGLTLDDFATAFTETNSNWLVRGVDTDNDILNWIASLGVTKKNAKKVYDYINAEPDENGEGGLGKSLKSPPNCTGQAQDQIVVLATDDTVFGWRWASTNDLNKYGLGDSNNDVGVYDLFDNYSGYYYYDANENYYIMSADNCDGGLGADNDDPNSPYLDDTYSYFADSESGIDLSDYGYVESEADISEPDIDEIETSTINSSGSSYTETNSIVSYNLYTTKEVKITRTYTSEVDGEEVEYEWVTYKYLIYKSGTKTEITYYYNSNNNSETTDEWDEEDWDWEDTIIFEFIIRDKTTEELLETGLLEYDEETGEYISNNPEDTRCDQSTNPKVCNNCKKYLKKVIAALAAVQDSDYASYTPYIARVLGSWFRDTYFVIPEEADVAILDYRDGLTSRTSAEEAQIDNSYGENSILVLVDEEYLAQTEEYWTAYVMNGDDYQLYYLNPNGTTSSITMETWLVNNGYLSSGSVNDSSAVEAAKEAAEEAEGVAFVKKAQTQTVTDLSPTELNGVLWSAYGFDSNGAATGWIRVEYEDENEEVNAVYDIIGNQGADAVNSSGGFYYNILTTNVVTQTEDAQRSETNATVKWLFKYRKYYTYDGTTETAMQIAADREAVLEWAKDYLSSNYTTLTQSAAENVANNMLAKYGRSALRQAYNRTILSYFVSNGWSFDLNDVTEEWLDWQLDMYYSGIIESGASSYYVLDDLAFIVTTDDEGNISISSITNLDYEAGENEEVRIGDPRNPDLISTTNITKTSLEAFTILENTKTLASEYAYRDFKELIVELDYFDKEDLSDAIASVFTWIIPELDPTGWPVRPWDKQDTDYGALIESAGTYEYLEETNYTPSDDSEEEEETDDEDDSSETSSSINESTIQFVGDSWIDAGLSGNNIPLSNYIDGRNGASASDFLSSPPSINSNASAIVVHLGLNSTTDHDSMIELIDELSSSYDIPIFIVQVAHVTDSQTAWSSTSEWNSEIDSFNEDVQSHCNTLSNVYWIDPTSAIEGLVDGYHLNSADAYQTWYDAIISGMNATSLTESAFEGYEGGEYVSSPVTGKIIEYGKHSRTNVYTGESEEVGYVVIEAMITNYFTSDIVANNSEDSDALESTDEIATALNLFYDEYKDTCAGFTITIDGFDVDLNITDEDGNNGMYEQNEVYALYNSTEQETREANEQAKDDAPFFINYGEDADLGSLPDEYVNSYGDEGYYIKEGKYLGVTYTDEEWGNLTITATPEGTPAIDEEEYTGPANYIRIMVKDTEYSIIDNVEDYFDIPDPEDASANGVSLVDGDTFVMPQEVLDAQSGREITYEAINRPELGMSSWSSGTTQRQLYELWVSQGSRASDGVTTSSSLASGLAIITVDGHDYIAVAVKQSFGNPGDYIQITFENGDVIDAIIMDAKGSDDGSYWAYGDHGLLDYGHNAGGSDCNVLEAVIKGVRSGSSYTPGDTSNISWWGKKVTQIVNAGSLMN